MTRTGIGERLSGFGLAGRAAISRFTLDHIWRALLAVRLRSSPPSPSSFNASASAAQLSQQLRELVEVRHHPAAQR